MYLMKLFVFTRSLKKRVRSCIAGILPYIALQLFLMMFAWPILLMWGLPISAASIIGYALFAPLLTLFLMLSSFIFFFELVSMPNKPFIWLLELLTQIWHTLLSISDRSWLWYFPKPPLLIALLIPLLACLIIQHRWAYSPIKIAACLCIFFFSTAALLTTRARNEPIRHIPCFEGELTVLYAHGNAALIDNTGCLGRRVSATNYVSYTLVPTLVQQGIQKLEYVIIAKPSLTIFRVLTRLIDMLPVKNIYLPAWQGAGKKNTLWAAWEGLLRAARLNCTIVHSVDTELRLPFGTQSIMLMPQAVSKTRSGLRYASFLIKS